jgi:hypothetical protein
VLNCKHPYFSVTAACWCNGRETVGPRQTTTEENMYQKEKGFRLIPCFTPAMLVN